MTWPNLADINLLTPTAAIWAQCGTAIKHPVPDRVKPSFVKFWHLGTLTLSPGDIQPWASECPNVKNYKWWLTLVWHRMFYSNIWRQRVNWTVLVVAHQTLSGAVVVTFAAIWNAKKNAVILFFTRCRYISEGIQKLRKTTKWVHIPFMQSGAGCYHEVKQHWNTAPILKFSENKKLPSLTSSELCVEIFPRRLASSWQADTLKSPNVSIAIGATN